MLGFHTSKTWNVPHEIPSNMFYDVGMMGESKKPEKEGHADPVGDPSSVELREAEIQPHGNHKESVTKSAPSSPRTIQEEYPRNSHRPKSKTLEQGPQKRRKRLPDYVTFSRATSKTLILTPVSINDVEKKKDSVERKINNRKDSNEASRLRNKLSNYSMYGLPRLSRDIRLHWEIREGNETSIRLENSWRDIVKGHENMSRKYSHQQEAVWELLCTELAYMKKLRIITDLVICTLINLHDANFLTEIQPENLFSNIPHIIRAHRFFWQEVIAPVLELARRTRQPFDPMSFQEGFQTFPERFKAYIHYCLEVKKKMEFARMQYKDNELFRVFVSWVEKHKQSHRLRLSDMLMRPHQRITKYTLLLKAILKRTEDTATREALNNMVSSVEQFLQNINTQMQRGEDYDKLRSTMDRIGAYDILEPGSDEIEKKVKAYTTLDLTCPIHGVAPHNIRQLLKEGPLKMKEGKEAKMEVHGLLFTDTFLIAKMHRKSELAKVVRSPIMLDKAVVQPLRDPSSFLLIYLNEFGCVALALSFQCASAELCKEWMDKFTSAQESLKALKAEEIRRQDQERRTLFLSSDFQNDLVTLDNSSLSRWSDDAAQDARSQSEFSIAVPRLIITEDDQTMNIQGETAGTSSPRTVDPSSSADEQSEVADLGYGTLLPPMGSDMGVNTSAAKFLRGQKRHRLHPDEDQRMTSSTSDLRHRHLSEPFDLTETSTASSGGSPIKNRELRRSMPQLSHIEQFNVPRTALKVHVTRLRPLPKYTVSTPSPFLKAPEAYHQSDQEEESSDSSFTARPLSRAMRGPSLVMETLRRAKHREKNWRHSLADSVDLYSDSQSDLSDAEELEVEAGSPQLEPNQEGQNKVIPREHDLSRLSLQEQGGKQKVHTGIVEIEMTEDHSNTSDSLRASELVQIEDELVSADEEDTSPNGRVFTFERSDSHDSQDDLSTAKISTDTRDAEGPPTPWLLSPNEFQNDTSLLNLSHIIMEPLLTEDIFLDIVSDANHQRRRLTKAELRRIRSIKINSTTTVSEV